MTTEHASPSGQETLRLIDVAAVDFAAPAADTAPDTAIAVPGARVGDVILATPLGTWPAGLGMGPNRCLVAGTVQTRLVNPTAGAPDPAAQTVRYAVWRNVRTGADRNSPSGRVQKITVDVTFDFANVVASTFVDQAVVVPGSRIGDSIIVTPLGTWPVGLLLGPHRCLADGTVQVRVGNVTGGDIDPASQTLRFTIFRTTTRPDRRSPSGRTQRRDVDVVVDVASIPTVTAPDIAVTVPGARVGDAILVAPQGTFDAGLGMGPHRCLVDGTVQMRIGNVTVGAIDLASQTYRFSLFKP
jgi:hypothetical protein